MHIGLYGSIHTLQGHISTLIILYNNIWFNLYSEVIECMCVHLNLSNGGTDCMLTKKTSKIMKIEKKDYYNYHILIRSFVDVKFKGSLKLH